MNTKAILKRLARVELRSGATRHPLPIAIVDLAGGGCGAEQRDNRRRVFPPGIRGAIIFSPVDRGWMDDQALTGRIEGQEKGGRTDCEQVSARRTPLGLPGGNGKGGV